MVEKWEEMGRGSKPKTMTLSSKHLSGLLSQQFLSKNKTSGTLRLLLSQIIRHVLLSVFCTKSSAGCEAKISTVALQAATYILGV